MTSLKAIKEKLGPDYQFYSSLSRKRIREILKKNDNSYADEVVFMLTAGCVNIEATLFLTENGMSIGYDCCVKDREVDGEWISYDVIPDDVNLNAESMEAEMFRVLDNFVTARGLSYTDCCHNKIHDEEKSIK